MAKITLDCKYCGAPLVIQSGETLVKCEYCGMTTVIEAPEGVGPLVEYAFMILENGRFKDASREFENVLRRAPKNSDAHLGKLMAEFQIKTKDEMKTCVRRFCDSENYKNLMKYGSPEWVNIVRSNNIAALRQERDGYIRELNEMKQYNQMVENNLKRNIDDALRTLKNIKITICVCAASAGFGFLFSLISSFGNSETSLILGFLGFYVSVIFVIIAVCIGCLTNKNNGKNSTTNSPFKNNQSNKTLTYPLVKERIKDAEIKLQYTCTGNRTRENEKQNKINALQAIIDDEEKKLQ